MAETRITGDVVQLTAAREHVRIDEHLLHDVGWEELLDDIDRVRIEAPRTVRALDVEIAAAEVEFGGPRMREIDSDRRIIAEVILDFWIVTLQAVLDHRRHIH